MSHNILTVEIEHSRYKTLLDDYDRVDGSVKLTTIQPHQHRAVISVYHERQGKRSPITDFEFIPPRGTTQEFPDLRLEGSWTGRNRAHLKLFHNGRLYAERDVRLPGVSPLAVAMPLVVLLVLGGVWLMWPSPPSDTDSEVRTLSRETPAEAVELPPAADPPPTTPPAEVAAPRQAPSAPSGTADPPTSPATPPSSGTADPPTSPATRAPSSTSPPPEVTATAEAESAQPREYKLVVYFRADSARITPTAAQELRDFAAGLPDRPAVFSRISGHAALAGPPGGRLPLSRQRAEAVSAALLTSGVEFGADVQVRGFGAEQPLTRNPQLQDNNRRVEVELRYPPENN